MNERAQARSVEFANRAATPRTAGHAHTHNPATTRSVRVSTRYLVCLGLLIVSAVGMRLLAVRMQWFLDKAPLPLRKPLSLLDQSALRPWYELAAVQPPPLDEDLLENLGTREYLNWYLVDRRRRPSDPTYLARLFVTYHTGKPDMVPHNPRECLAAGGWTLVDDRTETFEIRRPGDGVVRIPVSVLRFEPPGPQSVWSLDTGQNPSLTVVYFFYANGRYMTTRAAVRAAIHNPADRYAFYMKVEISFTDASGRRMAGPDETVAAARRLLEKLMPILWRDHLPDPDAARPTNDEPAQGGRP